MLQSSIQPLDILFPPICDADQQSKLPPCCADLCCCCEPAHVLLLPLCQFGKLGTSTRPYQEPENHYDGPQNRPYGREDMKPREEDAPYGRKPEPYTNNEPRHGADRPDREPHQHYRVEGPEHHGDPDRNGPYSHAKDGEWVDQTTWGRVHSLRGCALLCSALL